MAQKSRISVRIIVSAVLVSAVLLTAAAAGRDGGAVAASKRWIALVDSGKYRESWDGAASFFRSSIGRDDWDALLRTVREPLGKVLSRRIRETACEADFPGMPGGRYVLIAFETACERHKAAVETLLAVREGDGLWRVAGYCVQ